MNREIREEDAFSWGVFWRSIRPDLFWAGCGFGLLGLIGFTITSRHRVFGAADEWLCVLGIFAVSHLAATVFHYFPRGAESGLVRLSLAAFCRTFLPLLALMALHHYSFPLLHQGKLVGIVLAYLLSLGLTLVSALRGAA